MSVTENSKGRLAVLAAVLLLLLLTGFAFLVQGPALFDVPATPCSRVCKSLMDFNVSAEQNECLIMLLFLHA